MGLLIDTSVLVDCERGRLDLAERMASSGDERIYLSVITASELLVGIHRSSDAGHRSRRTAFVELVLRRFPILPIALSTARVHAEIAAALIGSGRPIGPNDLWLAATAVNQGLTLVTTNARELAPVPGLRLEDWSQRE